MPSNPTHQIEFQPNGRSTVVGSGTTILDAARQADIDLASSCGGSGHCGQCRVIINAGQVTEPTEQELDLLTQTELSAKYRLACCAEALSDLTVNIPPRTMLGDSPLQLEGSFQVESVDPMVQAHLVQGKQPDLNNPCADLTQITKALTADGSPTGIHADPPVIALLSTILRQHQWQVTAYVRGKEIVGIGAADERPLGLAVDMGTTKIAAYLLDLADGRQLAAAGALNPQTRYGDDIISRLNYVCRNPESRELATSLRAALDKLLHELTSSAGVLPRQVADVCLVGNTAMTHLLLELPVRQLATAPYVPATSAAVDIKARDLGLDVAPGAWAHILPAVGGFVGADHVAMILAAELDRLDQIALGVDIGTNTEIVLRDPKSSHLYTASCPSGPAFEGAHVSNGMRAASGAIERVELTRSGIRLTTIDKAPAVGLCGSGIVDAVAELFRWDLINQRGRYQSASKQVRQGEKGREFVLSSASASGTGADIVLSQKDIDEVQLAKGAIRAGIDALLAKTGIALDQVRQVFLAGAFGSYINLDNAVYIGLLPHFPNAQYHQVGNAAAAGAQHVLLSARQKERAHRIAAQSRHLELTTHPRFSRLFASGMMLPNKDMEDHSQNRERTP